MKSVLDGDVALKRQQKDRLKIVRDGIRKIVYEDEDLESHLDKDMESAIKLILNVTQSSFPNWEKINAKDDRDESPSDEPSSTSEDQESESETEDD